jgi:hypothetical protein
MSSGTIELPSGRWYWSVNPQWRGATVVFRHRDRLDDEMRSWTPGECLTALEALQLGREPLERVWVDVDGLSWKLSMDVPRDWRSEKPGSAVVRMRHCGLVFRRGSLRRIVEVPESPLLGEYTHSELGAQLERYNCTASGIEHQKP